MQKHAYNYPQCHKHQVGKMCDKPQTITVLKSGHVAFKDGNTISGNLRQTSRPGASSRSSLSSPSGLASTLQSNLFTRLATVTSAMASANLLPGQILLPDPSGMKLKFCPSKFINSRKQMVLSSAPLNTH